MSIDYSVLPLGKGKTVKQVRAKAKRQDAKAMRAFHDAVWAREIQNAGGISSAAYEWAYCQGCRGQVFRREEPMGDVHHIVSRRHKSTRYEVSNGQLLCRVCHQLIHGREF